MRPKWTAFVESTIEVKDRVEREHLSEDPDGFRIYANSRYQVMVSRIWGHDPLTGEPRGEPILQLSIKRNDRLPIHDWRDLQRIKNELVGAESLALEIYPPESKLVDTANQFFLWVMPQEYHPLFKFIFQDRVVSELSVGGSRQRPWPADERPSDLETVDTLKARLAEIGIDREVK